MEDKILNKYKVFLNNDGYVVGFCTVEDDDYDYYGQMADFPDACDGWYKFEKGSFVMDEKKKEEILTNEAKQNEIIVLKQNLADTDYIFSKELEEITSLSNPLTFVADIIKILVSYASTYKDAIAQRKAWRARIEELGG